MTFLAIILIIIGIIKIYLATTLSKYDIYPPTSLPIEHDIYVNIIKCLLTFDGLVESISGLFIVAL